MLGSNLVLYKESSQSVLKVSRLWRNFQECLANFPIVQTVPFFPKSFCIVWDVSVSFGKCPVPSRPVPSRQVKRIKRQSEKCGIMQKKGEKTWPPKTLKCSKSKTFRHRKLKSPHRVDLIRSTWCQLFSFQGLIVLDLEHFKVLAALFFSFLHPLFFNYAT